MLLTAVLAVLRAVAAKSTLGSAEVQLLLQEKSAHETFVSVWAVEAGQTLTLPAIVVPAQAPGIVHWGDGVDGGCPTPPLPCRHVYATGGLVRVTTNLMLAGWTMQEAEQSTRGSLVEIESWGQVILHPSSGRHFYNCTRLQRLPSDAPLHTNKLTSLEQSFAMATVFNSDGLSTWDTSNVITLRGAFASASAFDGDLAGWDVSRVQDAGGAFARATAFNHPLPWRTTNLRDTTAMFAFAAAFNQPLSGWFTGAITRANGMFMEATQFDQDLSTWRFGSAVSCRYFAQNSALGTEHFPQGLPRECH